MRPGKCHTNPFTRHRSIARELDDLILLLTLRG
jgi:hypothetical protein